MATIDVSEVRVGDRIPDLVRQPSFHHFNRFAAVNYEFVDHHMDDDAGRASGYPAALGMGNLTFAWLHCMLRDWIGNVGRIIKVECRFRAPVLRNDTVTCSGVVTARTEANGETVVELDIWSENQRGEHSTSGTATVALPRPRG